MIERFIAELRFVRSVSTSMAISVVLGLLWEISPYGNGNVK